MVNIIHQLLVLAFIYNSNDFVMLFQIVSADCLIDGSATVQGIDNKISQLFFFFSDDADPPLYILPEDKMIQNHAVQVGSQDAEDYRLFVINQGGGKQPRTFRKETWPYPIPYAGTYS